MKYKEKAEAYVRQQLPELQMNHDSSYEILAKSIQLQHWLKVVTDLVEWPTLTNWSRTMVMLEILGKEIAFNLTTGQPATEADYKAFCGIVGINQD